MVTGDFNFIGFKPNDAVREAAALALERIRDRAPYGAHTVALLERRAGAADTRFRCAIEVYTRYGPFTARAERTDPEEAIRSVERALLHRFQAWLEKRFQAEQSRSGVLESA